MAFRNSEIGVCIMFEKYVRKNKRFSIHRWNGIFWVCAVYEIWGIEIAGKIKSGGQKCDIKWIEYTVHVHVCTCIYLHKFICEYAF